ncbi:MAG: putative Coenzyme synthesis protein [Actinomycetia bacterium]|nr:putative Coenzyme synthesis protein [Actinomycetes bacterium]
MPFDDVISMLIPRLAACRVERVTLDGFRAESHGRFRGDRDSFAVTVATVRKLAACGLLCTPNSLAEDEEYRELCEFATANGAAYVLMNPLSSMGRGVRSRGKLASSQEHMQRIRALTAPFSGPGLDVVHIRFPNAEGLPLAGCEAGTIIYVFTGGAVTVCPYLVFAARSPQSRHDPGEFPAAVIASGERIGSIDAEVCPVATGKRRLLPVIPA